MDKEARQATTRRKTSHHYLPQQASPSMHWSKLPITDQIFTHVEPGTSRNTVIAASALRRHCESVAHPQVRVPLEARHTKLIMTKRGVEKPRLQLAMQTKIYLPLLFCHWPDDTHLLVDGSHSYCAQFYKGHVTSQRFAEAYIVEQPIWKNFIVTGLEDVTEEALLASDSGHEALQRYLASK